VRGEDTPRTGRRSKDTPLSGVCGTREDTPLGGALEARTCPAALRGVQGTLLRGLPRYLRFGICVIRT
jgi:hypothetical protein